MTNNLKMKYVFQKHRGLESLTLDDERVVRREIREYIEDLKSFNIDLNILCNIKQSYQDRNNILNIALIIINDEEIATELVETLKFPVLQTSMLVKIPPNVIDSYKEYLIAYMLLLGSEKYSNILRYFSIGTKMDGNEKGDDRFKGLKLKELGITSIILTSQGEFRYLDVPQDSVVGSVVTGTEAILRPKRTKKIGIIIGLIILLSVAFIRFYQKPSKVIHLVSGPHVELTYNKLGTLIDAKGIDPSGDKLVRETVFSDKKFESSISELIEAGIKSGDISNREISIIVMDGDIKNEDFLGENIKRTVDNNGLKLRINLKNSNALVIP